MSDTESEGPLLRPFADVLREIGGGQIAEECAVQIADLTRAVQATQRKGTFSLVITVEPLKNAVGDMLVAKAKVTVKSPGGDPVAALFWADDAGNLVRDNPHQSALFARSSVVAQPDARIGETG